MIDGDKDMPVVVNDDAADDIDLQLKLTLDELSLSLPRRSRVSDEFRLAGVIAEEQLNSEQVSSATDWPPLRSPPKVPARSPLRRPTRSVIYEVTKPPLTFPSDHHDVATVIDNMPILLQTRHRSFPSLKGILDSVEPLSKTLPSPPHSPFSISPMDDDPASSSSSLVNTPALTKRQHALHELLASERAYASDLVLVREIHIPLALGHPVPVNLPHLSSHSSDSSSRTTSTASDMSIASTEPPMTVNDVKIIFSNIPDLALFSDSFCEKLEEALGSTLEGGEGQDHVGILFLSLISEIEHLYKYYITRQATADEHLQSLPKTPALEAYYVQTRQVAASISHAWDLHSLLIKPVQRLLKYPLLLAAILDETPDSHPDKENLRLARSKIEEVARNVNEERRRAEVVRDVLNAKKKPTNTPNIAVTASVNLTKMKGLRRANTFSNGAPGQEGSEEAIRVAKMHTELKRLELFAQQFARSVLDWSRCMNSVVHGLRAWSISFGRVIGLYNESESEAFDAYLFTITEHLIPLTNHLESIVNEHLLKDIAHLLATMSKPLKLLDSMEEQAPFHSHLLNMNVSQKNRPPPVLLEASKNYLALRGQLAAELPKYLALMHRGFGISTRKLAKLQAEFWLDVRDRWGELWEMLHSESEIKGDVDETMSVWFTRWCDVDEAVKSFNVVQAKKLFQERSRSVQVSTATTGLEPTDRTPSKKSSTGSSVMGVLTSLEPAFSPAVSSPYPLSPASSKRLSESSSKKSLRRRSSNDSLPVSPHRIKSTRRPKTSIDEFGEYVAITTLGSASNPSLPRMKSMPLSNNNLNDLSSVIAMTSSLSSTRNTQDSDDRGRGNNKKQSIRRKIGNTLRTRSSSKHSSKTYSDPLPSPVSDTRPDSWAQAVSKYMCRVVHPCRPPDNISYFGYPFFTLEEGDIYEVLQEAGHPKAHPKLPLELDDDGADCLLLCRDADRQVGWALASFVDPLG